MKSRRSSTRSAPGSSAVTRADIHGNMLALEAVLRDVLLFHGSPDSHMRDLLATTGDSELEACLGERRAQVMAGGHTHLQLLRQHQGSWLVNPGSVGLPFRAYVAGRRPEIMPYAEYAIVHAEPETLAVELKRVALERAALRAAAHAWPNAPPALRGDLLLQYA